MRACARACLRAAPLARWLPRPLVAHTPLCSPPRAAHPTRWQDEKLLNLYRLQGRSEAEGRDLSLVIFDARSKIAAEANKMKAKGYEIVANYENTTLQFCGIGNIHTMRESLSQLRELVAHGGGEDAGAGWHAKLHSSGWLRHMQGIIKASVRMARALHAGHSVVNHCSDGWDRTAQMCAMSQLLLDPHFRTVRGFATLVEKDWCAFGYKFLQRCGHGSEGEQSERSPIFVQWLDGVAQVLRQFPTAFEFSEELLVFLADHVFSGLFGTFLVNFDRQRQLIHKLEEKTVSVWGYLFKHFERSFANKRYRRAEGALWPSWHAHKVTLWERYFLRWDPEMHPPAATGEVWEDDAGTRFLEREGLAGAEALASPAAEGTDGPPQPARQG